MLTLEQKDSITFETLKHLTKNSPDVIVTACPLCKKTFIKGRDVEVKDISEIVVKAINHNVRTTLFVSSGVST